MSEKNKTLRIDEILLWQGLVNEDQIKAALEYQREHGGRLGSHLMRLGFVTEEQLLGALAKQFNCASVVLSKVSIPPEVIGMLPGNVALARTVVPFAYDDASNTLSVACEDPSDKDLFEELKFIAKGKEIRLFVAAELSLRSVIAEHYVAGQQAHVAAAEPPTDAGLAGAQRVSADTPTVLLVSDDLSADQPLVKALENEEFRVVCSDSADDALGLIGDQSFYAVFVRDTVSGDYIDLIDRLRKVSLRTRVRFYESAGQMLLRESGYRDTEGLIVKNMQLFTTLLAARDQTADNHAGIVGQYVDKLCRHLGLPEKDRLNILNAAYLHDISRFYYGESEAASDCRTRVQMTVKLLDSLSYPPLVVGMLRSMYIDLEQKYTQRLPIEALGGNILTIVDMFCEHVALDKRMSLDRFEKVRNNLVALSGRVFLNEVADAFIEMIEQEILIEPENKRGTFNQVLMYCDDMDYLGVITARLKEEGFRPVAIDDVGTFVDMYRRSRPDIIILLQEGLGTKATGLITTLSSKGVELAQVPTYLVTSRQAAAELAARVDLGLEDVIPIENSLDLLVVKMQKLRTRLEEGPGDDADPEGADEVASGNLEEMSLLQLLQAMGPTCRTARIRVSSEGGKLTMCLDKGKVVYAKGKDKHGAEAIYEGASWKTGKWTVHPIKPDELPDPNNDTPLEDIFVESSRRIQESRSPSQ